MAVATALLNNFAGDYGDEALAAFSIVGRVMPVAASLIIGFVTLTNMYLQTTNQTASALTLAIARHGLFLIPALATGAAAFGLNGIIAAQPVSDVMSFLLAVPLYGKSVKSLESLKAGS